MRNPYHEICQKNWQHDWSYLTVKLLKEPDFTKILKILEENYTNIVIEEESLEMLFVSFDDESKKRVLKLSKYESVAIDYQYTLKSPDINATDLALADEASFDLQIGMYYDQRNYLKDYLTHLKMICLLTTNVCLLIDESAGNRVFGPVWLKYFTQTDMVPDVENLYILHQVYDEERMTYWFHSHSLNRLGLPEVELLFSGNDYLYPYNTIINGFIRNSLEDGFMPISEPVPLVQTINGVEYAVAVPWEEAIHYINQKVQVAKLKNPDEDYYLYPEEPFKQFLGDMADRDSEHQGPSCILFGTDEEQIYLTDFMSGVSPTADTMIFRSSQETERLRISALKTWSIFMKYFEANQVRQAKKNIWQKLVQRKKNQEWYFLVKCGIPNDEDVPEHLWFEPQAVYEDSVIGLLINEPFYVSEMAKNQIYEISIEQLSDWLIFYQGESYSPSMSYLLVEKAKIF